MPDGKTKLFDAQDFYDSCALIAGKTKVNLRHRAQAELAKVYVDLHRTGFVKLPISQQACEKMQRNWESYLTAIEKTFRSLASERTDNEDRQEAIIKELTRICLQYVRQWHQPQQEPQAGSAPTGME